MSKREKRTHPRAKFLKPVTFLSGAPMRMVEAVDAEFLDLSAGGACVVTDRDYDLDSFLYLRLEPYPRLAEVRWVARANGRFKMGLEFFM
jgi:hypothetical protein